MLLLMVTVPLVLMPPPELAVLPNSVLLVMFAVLVCNP
jgi:hypothetical protein